MHAATRPEWRLVAAGTIAALAMACGGSGTSPSTDGGPPVATSTITIANNAVSPANIIVSQGSQVTFTNNDRTAHDMESDPHPEHTDCPEINQVGFLNAGQSRQTGNLNTVRTCGFHDHDHPEIQALHGTIRIQ